MKLFQGKIKLGQMNDKGRSSLMIFAGLALIYTDYQLISNPEAQTSVTPVLFWLTIVVFGAGALLAFWRAYALDKQYKADLLKEADEDDELLTSSPDSADESAASNADAQATDVQPASPEAASEEPKDSQL